MGTADQLGLSSTEVDDVLEHFERESSEGCEYRHLPDARHGIERGTVLIDGTVVRGFPKIPRALVLAEGVPQYFDGSFAVEEKLNGYNVRIAHVGEVLAFTRSGYLCPYTTRAVRAMLEFGSFFDDHPDLMLCGEMIGPENPYTAHAYPEVESLAFRTFGVRDQVTGEPLPVRERRQLCEAYGFPQVPQLGSYTPDETAELPDEIRELNERGREGVVMKSLDGTRQLKYTTSTANRGDLAFAFSLPFDYGRDFVFRRIVREAFQAIEWDEDEAATRERAHALGESVLLPMIGTIQHVRAGETAGERHTVRGTPASIDALLDHLCDLGLTIAIEADRTEDGERVITFCKEANATTDVTRNYLDGHIVEE